jgi:hypothetical protein
MHEWAKKSIFSFFSKNYQKRPNLAKNSKKRPKILAPVKILHYNLHSIERYSKMIFSKARIKKVSAWPNK